VTGPRHLILGTAGHIDHGKTALVRALTGVDTDRLPEEKRRGITVDLGFAPLVLPDGTRLGVVDVPGHERLVHTMVAGAAGIDLLLLVVAADEGVMPQTREHLAICEVLGIDRAVVALTKMDVAEPDVAELAREEVAELLAATALAGAPIVPVSARTGEGLDALREALAARAADAPDRTPRSGPPRLPVDRAFEMRGFGAVATGTLVGGALCTGDAVALEPGGTRAKVRGLQVHGERVERAEPGTRCAVNLQGVAREALSRGVVVAPPDALLPTHTLDVSLRWLAGAPLERDPTSVTLLLGTAERRARVALVGRDALPPGDAGFARLHVDGAPVAALPGDRYVLRGFARTELGATLGGGVVLDVDPPHRRRSDPGLARDLAELATADAVRGLVVRVRRAGLAGAERAVLGRVTGLDPDALEAALDAAHRDGDAVHAGERVVAADALDELASRLGATLDAFHAAEPLRPGMAVETLRASLPANVPAAVAEAALARMASRGELAREREHVRRPQHQPRLDDADRATCEALVGALAAAGLEAPSLRDLVARLGGSAGGEARVRELLAHLEREGRVVHAPGDVWFDSEAVAALRERVRAHFARHAELDTPTFKALVGTSRRTAVPLMELLDEERVTVRRGGVRRPGAAARPA